MGKKKKYKTLEEIQNNPVWIKLQLNGTSKEQLDQQFLSLDKDEKIEAIDSISEITRVINLPVEF